MKILMIKFGTVRGIAACLILMISSVARSQEISPTPAINLNQLGFYPHAEKIAIITGVSQYKKFFLVDSLSRDTVFRGTLKPHNIRGVASVGKPVLVADFTAFAKKGKFILCTERAGGMQLLSHSFGIDDHIHTSLAKAAIKGFYFQRSSGTLDKKFAGKWARPAGHPDTDVLVHSSAADPKRPAGTVINSTGGWYDAGDYNKYIVNSGITMGTLLAAYEDFAPWFDTLNLNIPESGNQLPDLLDEVEYNLRWMLTMQDPNDGGVYHKCTNAAFDGNVMPGITKLPRYVVQKSTAATLDFVAVMAQAARVYSNKKNGDDNLSMICLAAAKRAWNWSMANPQVLYNQDSMNKIHQPAITTGAYGDRSLDDEWFWAAAEMYIATGEQVFLDLLLTIPQVPAGLPGWPSVRTMGIYSIMRHQERVAGFGHAKSKSFVEQLQSALLRLADQYVAARDSSGMLTVMGSRKSDFNWGSNSNAANQGMLLVKAWKINGNRKFLDAAISNLDYICGRNVTGYCFVTGFGTVSPMHPHHRPSVADGVVEPVPGLLAGGPNVGMQDKCVYKYTQPALAYTDDFCSYASNEIAINWNAPLAYLANAIEAVSVSAYQSLPGK